MTIRQALDQAARLLTAAGVDSPRHDAGLLLSDLVGMPPLQLTTVPEAPVAEAALALFFERVRRRAAREPLQHILGQAPFMGHLFEVSPEVLIPRFDTEVLAERAIARVQPGQLALDLCCGSGCLAISLKLARPEALVYAGDLSPAAVALSARNARRLGADVDIRQGDLFAPFAGLRFDLILSNPPYIKTGDLEGLQREVQQEPALALDGGPDGLMVYRRILMEAAHYLNPGGCLLLELGDGQAVEVGPLVPPGFSAPVIHQDLAGGDRVLETCLLQGVH
ncbi:MAG: peptide chain release factor N(5)-glutamine methyltransferase [Clostridiales bacterium]|nr:peptide chain release factor N(5)-glutamine methyltransferase [Clostridiales bacterium]